MKRLLFFTVIISGLVGAGPAKALADPGHSKVAFAPKAASLPPELAPSPATPQPPVKRKVWNKYPIPIGLPINRERLVSFNAPVRLEMPNALDESKLRTQIVAENNSSTVYWTAQAPFDVQRVQVQDIDSGNVYLLDLKAQPQYVDTDRIEVTLPTNTATQAASPTQATATAEADNQTGQPDYVSLTRMAAQHLYSPERLLTVPDGVYQAPVRQSPTHGLFRGGKIEATPIIAWRTEVIYITALKLKNLDQSQVELDPRALRGRWLTATFQHNLLLPNGNNRDTTAAYLISDAPYEDLVHGF